MEVLSSRTILRPTDLERSLHFYGTILGLGVAREFGEGSGRGVVFFTGNGLLEVVGTATPAGSDSSGASENPGSSGASESPGSSETSGPVARSAPVALWLQVRSVEGSLAELAEGGVAPTRPARLEPWGLVEAWVEDPDGLRIHLVEVPAGHPLRRDTRSPAPQGP